MPPRPPPPLAVTRHPKPPTPIATPRCSSPPSNIFLTSNPSGAEDQNQQTSEPSTTTSTFEDVTAQELFFNIEQLTLQAKESFDFTKVQQSIKANSAMVNREKLSNVGRSVVDNLATSKKLEFFKALANSTSTTPKSTAKKETVTPSTNNPKSKAEVKAKPIKLELQPHDSPKMSEKPVEVESSLDMISMQHQQAFSKLTPMEIKPRPVSPKYDIAFPQSNLNDIASPRPSSRIPKKHCLNQHVNHTPPSSPSIVTTLHQSDHQHEGSDHEGGQRIAAESETKASTLPRSNQHPKIKDTPSTRFLDEHHPGLTRSNSTLSNVSSYSQTTQEIFSSISSDLSGLATQTASSLLESMFGYQNAAVDVSGPGGNRRHRNNPNDKYHPAVSEENTISIKDTVDRVLLGEGVGWLKLNRLKKLLEEEMHRSLLLNYLQKKLGQHMTRDGHIGNQLLCDDN